MPLQGFDSSKQAEAVFCEYCCFVLFWFFFTVIQMILCCTHFESSKDSNVYSPLGAVGVARVAFVVGICILEDETARTLQAIGTLFHTIRAILEMEALYTMLWALWTVRKNITAVLWRGEKKMQIVCPHIIISKSAILKALNFWLLWWLFWNNDL